jgi:hypothetical protein
MTKSAGSVKESWKNNAIQRLACRFRANFARTHSKPFTDPQEGGTPLIIS